MKIIIFCACVRGLYWYMYINLGESSTKHTGLCLPVFDTSYFTQFTKITRPVHVQDSSSDSALPIT